MTNIALLHPSGLLGADLVELLGSRRELWREIRLLTSDDDEAGTLTEIGGAAAMVSKLEADDLELSDVVFFCGGIETSRPLISRLPPAATAIVLSPDAAPEDGHPVVAGVNLETAHRGGPILSPHPGTVLLAHLLHAIRDFRPERVTATLLQPVSYHSRKALDEVLEQTRGILAFDPNPPRQIFPAQMAFNVIPNLWPVEHLSAHLATVLGAAAAGGDGERTPVELAVRILQAGVFHSFGANVHVKLGRDPGPEQLRETLAEHPAIELAVDPEHLGMIDAAARDEVIVGPVERAAPGQYWVWAVMDNLICGGAANAIKILEEVEGQHVH